MSGSHVAVAHAVTGVEDVDPVALGGGGVRSTQHVGRHVGLELRCERGLLDEVISSEPGDPLTSPGRLCCSEEWPGCTARTLQGRNGCRRVDMQSDRLPPAVAHQLGAHRPPGANNLFVIECEDLAQSEALDDEQPDEQSGALVAGGCK